MMKLNTQLKSILIHLSSVACASLFVILGGLIFYSLENDNYLTVMREREAATQTASDALIMRLWHLARVEHVSREEFGKQSEEEYFAYVDAFYNETGGTKSHSRKLKDGLWSLNNAIYFAANMLTTIGYGFIAPVTMWGRAFSVCYGLLGIPLMLITVGNVAKFASELIFLIYRGYLALRFEACHKIKPEETTEMLNNVDQYMHKVKLFRFPAWSLFLVVILYGLAAAYLFTFYEDWKLLDSLYFTMISICTVGFGDIRPTEENQWFILAFVLVGVTITTMAMEIIGTMYLEELHFIGRQIRDRNPWTILRAARLEKRRRETANLLVGLAQFMAMTPPQRKKTHRRAKSRKVKKNIKIGKKISFAHEKAIGRLMFSKSAPDTPNECQVLSTSAHCIRLAWNPPFPQVGLTTYTVTCRPKHTDNIRKKFSPSHKFKFANSPVHNKLSVTSSASTSLRSSPSKRIRQALNRVAPSSVQPPLVVHGIVGCSFEVTNLESCSLYELTVKACNEFGESESRRLIEYTEPELSPQHVAIDKIGANAIRCDWEPPLKRQAHITGYVVYYTDERSGTSYDAWRRAELPASQYDYRLAQLDYDTFYRMCVRAVYLDGSYSPLSRAVVVRTDKLGFRPGCVGHSKSMEIMENISSTKHKSHEDETLPLLGDHHVYKHRSRYSVAC